jgi:SpoU rRNA methylase family enzyme
MALDTTTNGSGSMNTGSMDTGSINIGIEIDLADVLSLVGITLPNIPPTGSIPKPPEKIKLLEISGIVVDSTTNEPLSGVVATNEYFDTNRTNKKGEFTLKQPSLLDTGLDPSKFPLSFRKLKYSQLKSIPYTSTGDLKFNLGIIKLNPNESNLKKEITDLLRFSPSTVEKYATKDITFEFTMQKKLNVSINDLKATVIPLLLGLIAKYGISEVQKLAEKAKIDPKAVFDEIKDLISCPTQDEMTKIISTKNKLVKKINQTLKVINSTTDLLTQSEKILGPAAIGLKVLEQIPTPTAISGVGIPISIINTIQKTIKILSQLISKINVANVSLLSILTLLKLVLAQVLEFLNLLDLLTQYCYPDTPQSQLQVSTELTALTNQQSQQLSPVVTNVNGFEMGVETEITTNSLKRRRAIARNKSGVVMLKGEFSFSSIDQILIDELVFYIQQNDLKAD